MLKVIDISNWQAGMDIKSTGTEGVICKATQGTTLVDPSCDAHYQQAKALGLKLGVYHYASGGDPIEEADFFVDNIQGYLGEALLALDWEKVQNDRYYEYASWCLSFLKRVEERTGVKPLLYMSASVIKEADWTPVTQNGNGLWIAGYPDLRDSWDYPDFPYEVAPWEFAAIWQYTNSDGRLDRDIFFGDRWAWNRYAKPPKPNVHVEPQPHPEPVPEPPKDDYDDSKQDTGVELPEVPLTDNNYLKLPNRVYEILRWVVWIVMPAIGVLIATLNTIWNWNLPMEGILSTLSGVELFIGTVLGIAKISYDK